MLDRHRSLEKITSALRSVFSSFLIQGWDGLPRKECGLARTMNAVAPTATCDACCDARCNGIHNSRRRRRERCRDRVERTMNAVFGAGCGRRVMSTAFNKILLLTNATISHLSHPALHRPRIRVPFCPPSDGSERISRQLSPRKKKGRALAHPCGWRSINPDTLETQPVPTPLEPRPQSSNRNSGHAHSRMPRTRVGHHLSPRNNAQIEQVGRIIFTPPGL